MQVLGKRTACVMPADVPFTTNIVPATVGLLFPLAAGEQVHIRGRVLLSTGATGGVRVVPASPAAPALFHVAAEVVNSVAPSVTPAVLAVNTAATNALANAGTHWVDIEGTIINGATAGNFDLQFAQNSSDALTLTVFKGGWLEVTQY